ncbi:hypothetical protein ACP4OV_000108 [Aristida adscensionis]
MDSPAAAAAAVEFSAPPPAAASSGMILRVRLPPAWTPEEDARLARLAGEHGARRWRRVAGQMPGRSPGQCRARWRHHLARDVFHRAFTAGDDEELLRLFLRHAGRWRDISRAAQGRTSRGMRRRWRELRGTDAFLGRLWRPAPPPPTPADQGAGTGADSDSATSVSPHADDVAAAPAVASCSLALDHAMGAATGAGVSLTAGFACMPVV